MRKISGNAPLFRAEYIRITEELKKEYPALRFCECGKSLLGKSIGAMLFGEGEEKILYAGGTHGTEWLTSLLLFKFLETLLYEHRNNGRVCGYEARELYKKYTLIVVPEINPDGIEISLKGEEACGAFYKLCKNACGGDFSHWNANARGVDINHNFNAGWALLREKEKNAGIDGAAPTRYGGKYPESEPETKAMVRLCRGLDIKRLITFHSQGEEIYWEYGQFTPEKSLLEAKILAAVSEYTLVKNEGLASFGGFKDWFCEEFSRPAFTVEIGKGENPLPLTQLDDIYERLKELLTIGLIL